MKILVTGSTGLTGSEAVDYFRLKDNEVIGIDNDGRSKALGTPSKTPEVFMDITDKESIDSLFEEHTFDVVIHTAAQSSHNVYEDSPLLDFDTNTRGTVILLEALRKTNPKGTFIYTSSDKVYGTNMVRLLSERDKRFHSDFPFSERLSIDYSAHSLFGASKTAADLYVQEYGFTFNMNTVCFRLGCITGSRHEGSHYHGFLANLARCIKNEETFYLHGFGGKQVRDNIHSFDLVTAMAHFIDRPKIAAVYNMGGGEERSCSVLEAIEEIEKRTGKKAKIEFVDAYKADRAWDIHDVSKFQNDYPKWKYLYSLSDIFDDLCK